LQHRYRHLKHMTRRTTYTGNHMEIVFQPCQQQHQLITQLASIIVHVTTYLTFSVIMDDQSTYSLNIYKHICFLYRRAAAF